MLGLWLFGLLYPPKPSELEAYASGGDFSGACTWCLLLLSCASGASNAGKIVLNMHRSYVLVGCWRLWLLVWWRCRRSSTALFLPLYEAATKTNQDSLCHYGI